MTGNVGREIRNDMQQRSLSACCVWGPMCETHTWPLSTKMCMFFFHLVTNCFRYCWLEALLLYYTSAIKLLIQFNWSKLCTLQFVCFLAWENKHEDETHIYQLTLCVRPVNAKPELSTYNCHLYPYLPAMPRYLRLLVLVKKKKTDVITTQGRSNLQLTFDIKKHSLQTVLGFLPEKASYS